MASRDLVIEVLEQYEDSHLLLHGVSVSPGKPLILARVHDTPVFGLPGHPVSAMVCFDPFVVPLIRRLEGEAALAPFFATCPSRDPQSEYPIERGACREDLLSGSGCWPWVAMGSTRREMKSPTR